MESAQQEAPQRHINLASQAEPQVDTASKPSEDSLAIGEAGFIAVCAVEEEEGEGIMFTIAAKTRKELRAKIHQLIASEAKNIGVLEIYRARRLPLAKQVQLKF